MFCSFFFWGGGGVATAWWVPRRWVAAAAICAAHYLAAVDLLREPERGRPAPEPARGRPASEPREPERGRPAPESERGRPPLIGLNLPVFPAGSFLGFLTVACGGSMYSPSARGVSAKAGSAKSPADLALSMTSLMPWSSEDGYKKPCRKNTKRWRTRAAC